MRLRDIIDYYSRDDVQQALLGVARDREVVGVFRNGSFAKRPNTIIYPQDIVAMIRQGVQEFHCSLERWSQPMALRQENYNDLRKGWDLILDIDCKLFEHSKVATRVMIDALKAHDVKDFSVKYTGGKGFHIGIPWESMPKEVNYKSTVKQFPDLARIIGDYLRDFTKETLKNELLKICGNDPIKLAEQAGVDIKDIAQKKRRSVVDPYVFVKSRNKIAPQKKNIETDEIDISKIANIKPISDLDSVLISPRHLFRMPYSLNKKSFLVSVPLKPRDLESFEKESANPGDVKPILGFLDEGQPGDAEMLVGEAVDWSTKKRVEKKRVKSEFVSPQYRLSKETFPPCIDNILKGLQDGKKRSVFILTNFLSSAGWSTENMEKLLVEWNQKNSPPLRDNYIRTHVRWYQGRLRAGQKKLPPPSCSKEGYYVSIGVCKPDTTCGGQVKSIKNPLNYAMKKDDIKKTKYKSKGKSKSTRRAKPIYIQ
jgi:DNA primase catalytic subunit